MRASKALTLDQRADTGEWMDRPDCCERRLLRTVDQFDLINRLFSRALGLLDRCILEDMAATPTRVRRLVDLGAGGCDLPVRLLDRARRRGLKLEVVAVDGDPRIVRHAREKRQGFPGLEILEADALDPRAWPEADYVFGNHFLHHLDDEQVARLLKVVSRKMARRALFSDLRRSRWAYTGFRLVAPLLFRDSFAVADGLISIRKGFQPGELLELARQAVPELSATAGTRLPGRVHLLLEHKTPEDLLNDFPAGNPARTR